MIFECLAADKDRFIFAAHALAAHVTANQLVQKKTDARNRERPFLLCDQFQINSNHGSNGGGGGALSLPPSGG